MIVSEVQVVFASVAIGLGPKSTKLFRLFLQDIFVHCHSIVTIIGNLELLPVQCLPFGHGKPCSTAVGLRLFLKVFSA